jgi:uncharacterized membrane protein
MRHEVRQGMNKSDRYDTCMHADSGPFDFWLLLFIGASLILLAAALRRVDWHWLASPAHLNVALGACVFDLVLWRLRVPLGPGLDLHLLGASLLALMFGWPLATLIMALVITGEWLQGRLPLSLTGGEFLLLGAVPALASAAIHVLVRQYLARNLFIYFFVTAFFGTALASSLAVLARGLAHHLLGLRPEHVLPGDYLAFQLMLGFPEAFLTGMLATIFIIYRPDWMPAFDRRHYRLPY